MVGFPGETRETMNKTLDLAFKIKRTALILSGDALSGHRRVCYYQQNGMLATKNFREWLTAEGVTRCVLNLPDLTPQEIEAFCEQPSGVFIFSRAICSKADAAAAPPTEGWRSLKAGHFFIWYTLTNRRERQERLPCRPSPRRKTGCKRSGAHGPNGKIKRGDLS
jgi:hypothetical protein